MIQSQNTLYNTEAYGKATGETDGKTDRKTDSSPEGDGRLSAAAPMSRSGRTARLVFSIVFNIGMMVMLYCLFDPVFEGNDDITIVQFVNGACGSFDPHLVYQNYLMGLALSFLYRTFPAVPWYSWMQFWALCAAFTAVTYVLCCRVRRGAGFALSLLVQAFAAYECYIHLQYTKTAGVLAAAGMLLLWHGLWGEEEGGDAVQGSSRLSRPGRLLWGSVAAGLLLCAWSILYRYVQFAACAALTGGIPLLMLLDTLKSRKKTSEEDRPSRDRVSFFHMFLRCLAACAVLGALLAGLVRFDTSMYLRDPQWKNYMEYNNARSELMDYGMTDYEGHEDLYTELGINRNAYDLFDTWNCGDTRLFSTEAMRRLSAAREVKSPGIGTAVDFLKKVPVKFPGNTLFRCLLITAALWIFFGRHDGRAFFSILAEAGMFFVLYYYLYLKGRYLYNRVDVGLWVSVLLVLLWTFRQGGRRLPADVLRTGLIIGVMAVCAFVQIPGWKDRLASHSMEGRQKRAELRQEMQEICRDTDHLYVSKIGILSASRFCGPFEPMPQGILANVVTLGGWKVESVPFNAVLQAHGFTDNPYEAIAGNTEKAEKVFLLDEEIETTLTFLRDYYNPDAVAIEAGEWNGKTLWQVVTEKTPETGP